MRGHDINYAIIPIPIMQLISRHRNMPGATGAGVAGFVSAGGEQAVRARATKAATEAA